ncbi:MAG: aldo/keto reductase [Candidatus Omnitrophota bacterium]|nr:aldo/keto reductase [Candidatus Omnitrophota bacterium]
MKVTRREFLSWAGKALGAMVFAKAADRVGWAAPGLPGPALPTRPLGRTGQAVTLFSLGGEGILRTTGRMREAVPVIRRALEMGVNYFDTAPAYQQSQDYLGEGLQGDRQRIFLASKTHERSRDGSLKLLENSLRRLKTDHLDLWQLHDLREMSELEEIFSKDGAIRAVEEAKAQKKIRFVGITGHTAPDVLKEAVRRYPFDTALVAINPADRVRLSFIEEFLPLAEEKGMGVIAMKVMAHGSLLEDPVRLTPAEAMSYALGQPAVSTALIGCSTPEEVEQNAAAVANFQPAPPEQLSDLEERVRLLAGQYSTFKREG